jgi:hypothetical protein
MAVQDVVGLVRAAWALQSWQNISLQAFFGIQSLEPSDAFLLGLLLASGWAAVALPADLISWL